MIDIVPSSRDFPVGKLVHNSVAEALESDFIAIGNDLRVVLDEFASLLEDGEKEADLAKDG